MSSWTLVSESGKKFLVSTQQTRRGERDYRWTLTDEYRGDPDLRGEVISALSFFNFGA